MTAGHQKSDRKFLVVYLIAVSIIVFLLVYLPSKNLISLFKLENSELYGIVAGMLFFVVFWQVLAHFLFNPLLALLEAREQATLGSFDQSKQLLKQAQELNDQVEAKFFKIRSLVAIEREEALKQKKKEANGHLAEAAKKADSILLKGRDLNRADVQSLRENLLAQKSELAKQAVHRIRKSMGVA